MNLHVVDGGKEHCPERRVFYYELSYYRQSMGWNR